MSVLSDLQAARENLALELRRETQQRLDDQAAGKGVKTTYSANGRSVDWNGYAKSILDNLRQLDEQILAADPYEHVTQAWTG